ncbi:CAP domain-containing protein [Flexibacterium corallicola]|uniref:CAP domain-containing protein n=1 Tax=Flexibacterium corallicola TaxID=3037259 RepID=UPI00286F648E|nr:CAP domain-containing protein [Pseudovibrio sp. M1P-2-3]
MTLSLHRPESRSVHLLGKLMPVASFITCLLLLAGCAGLSGARTKADLSEISINRQEVLRQTNEWRAKHGLPALKLDPHLNEVSQDMANHIAAKDSLGTSRHSAGSLQRRTAKGGYRSYAGAENLGAGYADINAVMVGWKTSKDHNKNLLNSNVTHMGVARTNRTDGTYRNFWVMTLAAPKTATNTTRGPMLPMRTGQTTVSITP